MGDPYLMRRGDQIVYGLAFGTTSFAGQDTWRTQVQVEQDDKDESS